MEKRINKKAQIWVETVLYTFIAFLMMGLVLSYAKPKIEETRDKAIIEQSIELLNQIDKTINDIQLSGGNQRIVDIGIKRGIFKIDGGNDKLIFEIVGKYTYSEPGQDVVLGNLIIHNKKEGETNTLNITRNYNESFNLTYEFEDESKSLDKSSSPYRIAISNQGELNNKVIINFKIV